MLFLAPVYQTFCILISCQLIAGDDLEPFMLFRIIEVLHSAYKAGHIQIADHISFFITLLSRFRVFPGIQPIHFLEKFSS